MSYLALARKWRPRTFADVVGQEHVVRALLNALSADRVHHAYLFAGTRGVGKTTVARILAKALNCESGVSGEPCGECSACVSIDEGRFVDLIEVDAASRTKVDDTRELLENVQYTPTAGRYKVYLIDEVHMLSNHSFNALLKTLEEPPPHVKFLLATTDPQKLPVTVLSRCLQFNLKRLSTAQIVGRMAQIAEAEGIEADAGALNRIGRAAAGSMRDGLSLLDQALAFGGGALRDADVADMLGSMDQRHIADLLQALADQDALALMSHIRTLHELVPDYEAVLDDLATVLQQIAVLQLAGADALDEDTDVERLQAFANSLSDDLVQLYYQIAITGRRDLGLAPDPRTGFEMTLLRMLAFQPDTAQSTASAGGGDSTTSAAQTTRPDTRPAANRGGQSTGPSGARLSWDESWGDMISALGLSGAALQLAQHCEVESLGQGECRLKVPKSSDYLLTERQKHTLSTALQRVLGGELAVHFEIVDEELATPAASHEHQTQRRVESARSSIDNDPNVRQLMQMFDAEVDPDSVKPVNGRE